MKKEISMADLLLWTYSIQKAHMAVDQGRGLFPDERRADGRAVREVSGCGVARCMDNAVLGTEIDYFGPDVGSLHPDAEEVHDLVRHAVDLGMMDYIQVGQIIHFGQTGSTPDWMEGAKPQIGGIWDKKGRPRMVYLSQEDQRRRRNPIACELQITLNQWQIDTARDIYGAWVDAVRRLYFYYRANPMKLNNHRVVATGVASCPWQKDIDMCISI